ARRLLNTRPMGRLPASSAWWMVVSVSGILAGACNAEMSARGGGGAATSNDSDAGSPSASFPEADAALADATDSGRAWPTGTPDAGRGEDATDDTGIEASLPPTDA